MIPLITDRTEADVLLGNAKGRYRYTDLNRVETAVTELCGLARQLGHGCDLCTKTDWGIPGTFPEESWMTETQAARYLQNVRTLCDRFAVKIALPETLSGLDHNGANAIEQALAQVSGHIQAIGQTFSYSGDFYAGEEYSL